MTYQWVLSLIKKRMSIYQKIENISSRLIPKHKLFKYGFNYSSMYNKRSTIKIIEASENLLNIRIKLPLIYKNKNFVNFIFGGSLFSSVELVPMVQLIHLLEEKYTI